MTDTPRAAFEPTIPNPEVSKEPRYTSLRFSLPPELLTPELRQKQDVVNALLTTNDLLYGLVKEYADHPLTVDDFTANPGKPEVTRVQISQIRECIKGLRDNQSLFEESDPVSDNPMLRHTRETIAQKIQVIHDLEQSSKSGLTETSTSFNSIVSADPKLFHQFSDKFANVAHDTGTILAKLNFIQLAAQKIRKGEQPESCKDFIDKFNLGAKQSSEYFLEASEVLSQLYPHQKLSLSRVVQDIEHWARASIATEGGSELGITFSGVELDPKQYPTGYVDFSRTLVQALTKNEIRNIINQAKIKTTDRPIHVSLSFEIVDVNGHPTAFFHVSDTGEGIDEGIVAEGFQAGKSGIRNVLEQNPDMQYELHGGTGEGMAGLRKPIIEQYKGELKPSNTPTGGRVSLILPFHTPPKSD